jgi:hypothetical protein
LTSKDLLEITELLYQINLETAAHAQDSNSESIANI